LATNQYGIAVFQSDIIGSQPLIAPGCV